MYLGLVIMVVGVAILLGSSSPVIVIPIVIWILHSKFILREENGWRVGSVNRSWNTRAKRPGGYNIVNGEYNIKKQSDSGIKKFFAGLKSYAETN